MAKGSLSTGLISTYCAVSTDATAAISELNSAAFFPAMDKIITGYYLNNDVLVVVIFSTSTGDYLSSSALGFKGLVNIIGCAFNVDSLSYAYIVCSGA
jgi:hypothetical protein